MAGGLFGAAVVIMGAATPDVPATGNWDPAPVSPLCPLPVFFCWAARRSHSPSTAGLLSSRPCLSLYLPFSGTSGPGTIILLTWVLCPLLTLSPGPDSLDLSHPRDTPFISNPTFHPCPAAGGGVKNADSKIKSGPCLKTWWKRTRETLVSYHEACPLIFPS